MITSHELVRRRVRVTRQDRQPISSLLTVLGTSVHVEVISPGYRRGIPCLFRLQTSCIRCRHTLMHAVNMFIFTYIREKSFHLLQVLVDSKLTKKLYFFLFKSETKFKFATVKFCFELSHMDVKVFKVFFSRFSKRIIESCCSLSFRRFHAWFK